MMKVLLVRVKTAEVLALVAVPDYVWPTISRRQSSGLELLDFPDYRRLLMERIDLEVDARHSAALIALADISRTGLCASELLQPLQTHLTDLDVKEHVKMLVQRKWEAVRLEFNIPG